jgi:molybdate transport system substrate-binding protein
VRVSAWTGLAVALLPTLTACADEDRSEVRVLAASSLSEAFDTLEQTYESEHEDVDVVLSYDSSATLAAQVLEGAPADVLATADLPTMQTVVDEGLTDGEPQPFATNTLALITPADNPAGVNALADLESVDVLLAVCVSSAPCGAASSRLLALAGVSVDAATEEDNVKGVLTKVVAGEVDAGLVYASDAKAAGDDVAVVPVPNAEEVVNVNPITVLSDSEQLRAAQDWVSLVLSADGQDVLADLGFGPVR